MQEYKDENYFVQKMDKLFRCATGEEGESTMFAYLKMISYLKEIYEDGRTDGLKEGFEGATDIKLN